MTIARLPIDSITPPDWNPNQMDDATRDKLKASLIRFGLVVPLVVRQVSEHSFETIGGAQRLSVLRELGAEEVTAILVEADDAEARLLAQALNRIQGEDDLGLRAKALRHVLSVLPQEEVLSILPESKESLKALASVGEMDMAQHLQAWQAAQAARLRHMTFQLIPSQLEVVEEALERALAGATKGEENPNRRGNALFYLCKDYLQTQRQTV